MKRIRKIKEQVIARAGETFTSTLKAAMNAEKAAGDANRVRDEYRGLPNHALADILIRRAARKTKWEGAGNGLGVTALESLVATPAPEPTHKVAAGAGVVALLLGDIAYTTRVQMQLLLAISELYGCPFESDDEEDAYAVFKAALGLKGTEKIGSYGRFIFTETARKQFRRLLRTGVRRAVQDRIIKIAGPRIGAYLGEKSVMRLIPIGNAAIGYAFNNKITKSVGRWAKIKAKIRSSAFKQIASIRADGPTALVWVLPVIFHDGTADNTLTDNFLTLYSQTKKRLLLQEQQQHRTETLIDRDDLPQIFADELPLLGTPAVRQGLYDIALTAAAVNLAPSDGHTKCLSHLAGCLKVEHRQTDLNDRVSYFSG